LRHHAEEAFDWKPGFDRFARLDKLLNVDACLDAELTQEKHAILRIDAAGGPRCEWATTQPANRRIDGLHARFDGRDHIG
jgi:hypothetical protein